jgi:hypothetical protein
MPKRTAILLVLIALGVLSLRYAMWRRIGDDSSFRDRALRIGELSLLAVTTYWATWSHSPARRRWSLMASAGAFVVIETLALTPSLRPYRISWSAYLVNVPTVFGVICSCLVIAGWMSWRGWSLELSRAEMPRQSSFRRLFTLREVFVLTLVCALLLGLTAQASEQFSIVGIDRRRYMLFFWLRAIPFGVVAGVAAVATLLPGTSWRRIIVGSPVCLIPFVAVNLRFRMLLPDIRMTLFLGYYLLHYLALAAVFWTLRSAGYRLVWRETAALGDNPTPAG